MSHKYRALANAFHFKLPDNAGIDRGPSIARRKWMIVVTIVAVCGIVIVSLLAGILKWKWSRC